MINNNNGQDTDNRQASYYNFFHQLINEDPVCGSAHSNLIPYWAEKLEKNEMTAYQASARGGYLKCELKGNRVSIGGKAVLFAKGETYL